MQPAKSNPIEAILSVLLPRTAIAISANKIVPGATCNEVAMRSVEIHKTVIKRLPEMAAHKTHSASGNANAE